MYSIEYFIAAYALIIVCSTYFISLSIYVLYRLKFQMDAPALAAVIFYNLSFVVKAVGWTYHYANHDLSRTANSHN